MSTMNYWDLSNKERAALKREDVEKYIAYELMSRGISRLPEPIYEDEGPEIELPEPCVIYSVSFGYETVGYFETMEEAQIIQAALAKVTTGKVSSVSVYDYRSSRENPKFFEAHSSALKIEEHSVFRESELTLIREALKVQAIVVAANDEKRTIYKKSISDTDTCLTSMWDDWGEKVEMNVSYAHTAATWEEFLGMCDGNRLMAMKFMLKGDRDHDLHDVWEWLDWDVVELDSLLEEIEIEPQAEPDISQVQDRPNLQF